MSPRRTTIASLLVATLLLGAGVHAAARSTGRSPTRCTSLIVGKDATADGSVLLAHNEDLDGRAAQHAIVVEPADHPPGTTETLVGGTVVDVPGHTHGYVATTIFDVHYIPGDVTGGVNDQGLMVANNLAYGRDASPSQPFADRVLWSEFTRLTLARAATAREAVDVVGGLVEQHGLGLDSGTMIGVADATEGWWIELALDGQWIAQRVPDDGFAVRANTYRIGVVDLADTDNVLSSPDLVAHATARGWYVSGPFDFAAVYGDPGALDATWNTHRQERLDGQLTDLLPAVTSEHVMALLRDHYEGTTWDLSDGYTFGSPHDTAEYCVCDSSTEVSLVCRSREGLPPHVGALCWRAMATPCSSAYVPWYAGHTDVPVAYTLGEGGFSDDSAWWAFRALSQAVDVRYDEVIHDLRAFWGEFEDLAAADLAVIVTTAAATYEDDPDGARALLTEATSGWAELAYGYAQELLANDLDVSALELPQAGDDDDSAEPTDDDDSGVPTDDDDDSGAVVDDDDDDERPTPPGGGDDEGCGCSHEPRPAAIRLLAPLLLAAAAVRRRRTCP